ncbi:hypothetical protein [Rickettsia endosymbiont of Orchestes rusci]|uniref:hypothetical protein n=1 Tax=Rickettsia endosymbiont of Orchestes rusci TaxID=3066250 RepID=UPI00313C185A
MAQIFDVIPRAALLRRWLKSLKIVIPWLDPLLYERLNKEVKILSFRGYDHGIQLIIS